MKRVFIFGVMFCLALTLGGCFKDTVNYTRFEMAIYNQSDSEAAYTPATDIHSYAYYADTAVWRIASYEDAVNRRLTNKSTGEVLSTPDVEGSFDPALQYQLSLTLERPLSLMVVVNPTLRLYAYRQYELPENLEVVQAKLYMASWRPTHQASGWNVVNEFYTAQEAQNE